MHKILEIEEYVEVSPMEKTTVSYKLAYMLKENIRTHKWNRGTEDVVLTWEEARDEWMEHYYDDFIEFFKSNKPKRKRSSKLSGDSSLRISKPFHVSF